MMGRWLAMMLVALAAGSAHGFRFCDQREAYEAFNQALPDLRKAFTDRRIDDLQAHFDRLLAERAVGLVSDAEVKRAFAVFEHGAPGREPTHLDWIRRHPRSQAAFLALGYHYMTRGLDIAGRAPRSVSASEMEAAGRDLVHALRAFDIADQRGPDRRLSAASRIRIASSVAAFNHLDAEAIYRRTLRISPDSLEVRIQFIKASHPSRGGSLAQIASIAGDTSGLKEPDRRYLRYLVHQELGYAQQEKDPRAAAQEYDKSIPLCPGLDRSIKLAMELHDRSGDHASLERSATSLLQQQPRHGWGLAMRAKARKELGKFADAFADYQRSAELGCACALEGLAWFHETGTVVARDIAKALELYRFAEAREVPTARAHVERLRAVKLPVS